MKRFLLTFLFLSAFSAVAFAERGTVLLHPGDVVYVRFDVKGTKIRLFSSGKEENEAAQLVFTFEKEIKGGMHTLQVENKFPHDLVYKVEMRSLSQHHEQRAIPTPVVGGKMAFDQYPAGVEELALFDFKLEP